MSEYAFPPEWTPGPSPVTVDYLRERAKAIGQELSDDEVTYPERDAADGRPLRPWWHFDRTTGIE